MKNIINSRNLNCNPQLLSLVTQAFQEYQRDFPEVDDFHISNATNNDGTTGAHGTGKAIDLAIVNNLSSPFRKQIPMFARFLRNQFPNLHIGIGVGSPHIHVDNFYTPGLVMDTGSASSPFAAVDYTRIKNYYGLTDGQIAYVSGQSIGQQLPDVVRTASKWWWLLLLIPIVAIIGYFTLKEN